MRAHGRHMLAWEGAQSVGRLYRPNTEVNSPYGKSEEVHPPRCLASESMRAQRHGLSGRLTFEPQPPRLVHSSARNQSNRAVPGIHAVYPTSAPTIATHSIIPCISTLHRRNPRNAMPVNRAAPISYLANEEALAGATTRVAATQEATIV